MLIYACKPTKASNLNLNFEKRKIKMTTVANERNANNIARKEKFLKVLKNILIWTGVIIGGAVLLVALYQILQVLFVGAILLIAWLGPVFPRRWR